MPLQYGTSGYYEYLFGEKPSIAQQQKIKEFADDFTMDIPYSILFVYTKTSHITPFLGGSIGGVGGLVVGTVASVIATGGFGAIPIVIGVVSGAAAGGAGYALGSEDSASWSSSTVLYPYTKEAIAELGCEEMPAKQ